MFDDVQFQVYSRTEEEAFLADEWKKQISKIRDLHQSIQHHFLGLL
jgi:hypothetical protein